MQLDFHGRYTDLWGSNASLDNRTATKRERYYIYYIIRARQCVRAIDFVLEPLNIIVLYIIIMIHFLRLIEII